MFKPLPLLTALIFLVAAGLLHGLSTERWQRSRELEDAVKQVQLIPLKFGPWQGKELETETESFFQAGAQGYWMREYTNAQSKMSMVVILMCGRSGRMAVHTPEVCYSGAGFEMRQAAPTELVVHQKNQDMGFWTARFAKEAEMGADLRLYWSWNDGRGWQAPRSPRWHFRNRPFLYKLYISQETTPASERQADEQTVEFIRQFLDMAQKILFSP